MTILRGVKWTAAFMGVWMLGCVVFDLWLHVTGALMMSCGYGTAILGIFVADCVAGQP